MKRILMPTSLSRDDLNQMFAVGGRVRTPWTLEAARAQAKLRDKRKRERRNRARR